MDFEVKKATEGTLSEIHFATARLMLLRLEKALNGELDMPPSELSAIIKFLKDNGIECTREDMERQFGGILRLAPPNFTVDAIEEIEEAL